LRVEDTGAGIKARKADIMRILAWPHAAINPYTPLLYADMGPGVQVNGLSTGGLLHRYDVWHIHWPESLLNIRNPPHAAAKLAVFFAILDYLRWRDTKIVWTMHNFKAHEGLYPSLEARFWPRFIPRVDAIISLSDTGLSIARSKFPRLQSVPAVVIPHGHYRDEYPPNTLDSRAALGIPPGAKVILFFGAVRAYKNVDALMRAFRTVSIPGALLYVVGQPNTSALRETILREAAADSRVRLESEFIARDEVAKFMQAADLVVLPYRTILNSGSALLALSFNRPILVPDLGSMGDLRMDFGSQWVRTFAGDLDGTRLERALEWAFEARPALCPMPEKYDWPNIRAETVRFYRQVIEAA
jgi:beta-1,4-mannosyltransferase